MGRDLQLATKLRDHRLRVVEVADWQSRGGSSFRPRGSVTHHTAGPRRGNAPSLGVVIRGRADLPGPLANVLQARDNTIYLVAAGRANHAGEGGWRGLVGNSAVYGNEVENIGHPSEPWRDDQIETMARVAAAFAEGNHGASMACLHKEWAPRRKIDPHSLNGGRFRAHVAAMLGRPGPSASKPPPYVPPPTPAPKPPASVPEEEVVALVQGSGPAIYSTNWVTKTHLNAAAVKTIQFDLRVRGLPSHVAKISDEALGSIPTTAGAEELMRSVAHLKDALKK